MTRAEVKKLAKITGLVLGAHDVLVAKHYELPPEKRPQRGSTPEINGLYEAYKLLQSMRGGSGLDHLAADGLAIKEK